MITPESLQKPGASGVPIVLADGQTWYFRKPMLCSVPTIDANGVISFGDGFRAILAGGYDKLVDAYVEADGEALDELVRCLVFLLEPNYDIKDHLPALLVQLFPRAVYDDPDNDAIWLKLIEVVLGRGPKPIPIG